MKTFFVSQIKNFSENLDESFSKVHGRYARKVFLERGDNKPPIFFFLNREKSPLRKLVVSRIMGIVISKYLSDAQ